MSATPSAANATAPGSPLTITQFKDAWGAVRSTEASLTDKQRVVVLGEPIPIVFGKIASGIGGVWVYPSAARYAVQLDTKNIIRLSKEANREVYEYVVNLGLVVSEGQIGAISASDVYKGELGFSSLSNTISTFAYGSMPTAGFNYINSAIDSEYDVRPLRQAFTTSVDISVSGNITRLDIAQLMVVDTGSGNSQALFTYQILINGTVVYDDGATQSSTPRDKTLTYYSPNMSAYPWTNVVIRITTLYSGSYNLEARAVLNVYQQKASTTDTMISYGFPENPGSGGSFQGLSCLALQGTYPAHLLQGNAYTSTTEQTVTPSVTSGYISYTCANVTSFSIYAQVFDGAFTLFHGYELYVDGVLVRDNANTYTSSTNEGVGFETDGVFTVEFRAIPVPGNPFPGTANGEFIVTCTTSTSNIGKKGMFDDQVRCFVRNGIEVYNVLTATTASSNNFADLVYYMLTVSGNVPTGLMDTASFATAATFIAANNLRFDGVIAAEMNIKEYLENVCPFFLVYSLQIDGKYALRPVLPTNIDGTLNSGPITPSLTFDRTNIEAGSYRRDYIPLNDRKDICTLLTYRDQSTATYSTEKIAEVRYTGTAANGPYLEYDLSQFCSNINQAGFVGKYILANRKHVTHTIEFSSNVGIGQVAPMDIVRVRWNYADVTAGVNTDTAFYQIQEVNEGSTGAVQIRAIHFPTNASDESLVIADMLGSGYTGP
jgi:hypothetical protein